VCGGKTYFGMPRQEQQQLPVLQSGASFAAGAGFGHETNKVTIFDQEGSIEAYELKSKDAVARDIASFIIKRLG